MKFGIISENLFHENLPISLNKWTFSHSQDRYFYHIIVASKSLLHAVSLILTLCRANKILYALVLHL